MAGESGANSIKMLVNGKELRIRLTAAAITSKRLHVPAEKVSFYEPVATVEALTDPPDGAPVMPSPVHGLPREWELPIEATLLMEDS